MSFRMSSPPRRAAALAAGALAGALAAALLTGCQSAASDSGERRPVTEELSILMSAQNQLYYPPFLRDEPTGPQDNAYAQRTRALLGTPPRLDLNHKTAEFFRQDALGSSPLWGRGWLVPLAASGADGLLNDRDAADVRRMRTADGWYRAPLPRRAARSQPTEPAEPAEPAGQQAKNAYRAAATATALEILRAHGGITEADRRATLPWLHKAAAHPGTLSESADVARGLRLLNAPSRPGSPPSPRRRPPNSPPWAGSSGTRRCWTPTSTPGCGSRPARRPSSTPRCGAPSSAVTPPPSATPTSTTPPSSPRPRAPPLPPSTRRATGSGRTPCPAARSATPAATSAAPKPPSTPSCCAGSPANPPTTAASPRPWARWPPTPARRATPPPG
ncbi:hypothetical protein SAZ11_34005 [Streptomyces sp. FXJ1.4098]|nr:hypothetical protein [Streptomyces sp. FXJ1.4098]